MEVLGDGAQGVVKGQDSQGSGGGNAETTCPQVSRTSTRQLLPAPVVAGRQVRGIQQRSHQPCGCEDEPGSEVRPSSAGVGECWVQL